MADRCLRPVTGIDNGVIRQHEQLGLDAFEKQLKAAAGKVGSANTAAKEHVAAEHDARRVAMNKDDVPARMPWYFVHLQGNAREIESVSLAHQTVGGRAHNVEAERGAHVLLGIGKQLRFAG